MVVKVVRTQEASALETPTLDRECVVYGVTA